MKTQFKSINTFEQIYDDMIKLIWRVKISLSPFWELNGLFFVKTLSPLHTRILCVKFGWNWPSGSGEKDYKLFWITISLFSPLYCVELHLKKLAFCKVWLKSVEWFWRKRISIFVNVFSLFCKNLPLKKSVSLNLKIFESSLKIICAKFGWNWPSGSGGEDFKILSMYFNLLFR